MVETRELKLCPSCKGVGKKSIEIDFDYHKRESTYKTVICDYCDGKGRIYVIDTHTIRIEKLGD